MLPDDIQIISVDDHVIEGPDTWLSRLPAKYADVAPRIVRAADGNDRWLYEGEPAGNFALNAVAGKDPKDFGLDPRSFDDMLPGCYDIKERLKDMDLEGVHAQACFSNMAGFAGRVFFESRDKDLGAACVGAYNDFLLDEWCAYDPGRQIPVMLLPFWDVGASVAELQRTAASGARAVSFLEAPHRLGFPSYQTDHWDPLFAAAEEAGIVMMTHFGTGGTPGLEPPESLIEGSAGFTTPDGKNGSNHAVLIAMMGINSMASCMDLILSKTFHKFPALKWALAEGGAGWIPYVLERCDYVWERHRFYNDIHQHMRPSEVFRRNMYGCFISDQHGIDNRHIIGIDNLMFESDYPHSDSQWPNTRKLMGEAFANVPEDETRKILEGNARTVFNFPRADG